MRPKTLSDFVGQQHLVAEGKIIQRMIKSGELSSLIFWGPPGVGKTTLASIISHSVEGDFHTLSGVTSGKDDLRAVFKIAAENKLLNKKTILFIDEIHRWNKAQQDTLLPHVEKGEIILIGATTENPSFEIISALLSRSRVFVMYPHTEEDLRLLLKKSLTDTIDGVGKYKKTFIPQAEELIIRLSGGDARTLLNVVEIATLQYKEKKITEEMVKEIFQTKSTAIYDKKAEEHYNTISAFIKSMRASQVDAALYYLAKMLEGGEDPKFIARRMIIFASEDIGLADRGALIQANAAFEAVNKIGMPESQLILAHIVVYLAKAPKSRSVTNALGKALQSAKEYPNEPIPLHLRNAPTQLMKDLGYAKGYEWSEEHVGPKEELEFLPEKLKKKKFFE